MSPIVQSSDLLATADPFGALSPQDTKDQIGIELGSARQVGKSLVEGLLSESIGSQRFVQLALSSRCQVDFTGRKIASFEKGTYSPSYERELRGLGVDLVRISDVRGVELSMYEKLAGYFLKPIKVVWDVGVQAFDDYLAALPGKFRRNLLRSLKKSEGVTVRISYLDREKFERWYAVYEREVVGRERGRQAIDRSWYEKKGSSDRYKIAELYTGEGNEYIGGSILSLQSDALTLTIAYAAYQSKFRNLVPGARVFRSAMELADMLGCRILSHGQDNNLYGHYLSPGLMGFKSELGFRPRGIEHEVIKVLNPQAFTEGLAFFAYRNKNNSLTTLTLSDKPTSLISPVGLASKVYPITYPDDSPTLSHRPSLTTILPEANMSIDQHLSGIDLFSDGIDLFLGRRSYKSTELEQNFHPSLPKICAVLRSALGGEFGLEVLRYGIAAYDKVDVSIAECVEKPRDLQRALEVAVFVGERVRYDDLQVVVNEILQSIQAPYSVLERASSSDGRAYLSSITVALDAYSALKRESFIRELERIFSIDKELLANRSDVIASKWDYLEPVEDVVQFARASATPEEYGHAAELYARLLTVIIPREPFKNFSQFYADRHIFSDTLGGRAANLVRAALLGEDLPQIFNVPGDVEKCRIAALWRGLSAKAVRPSHSPMGLPFLELGEGDRERAQALEMLQVLTFGRIISPVIAARLFIILDEIAADARSAGPIFSESLSWMMLGSGESEVEELALVLPELSHRDTHVRKIEQISFATSQLCHLISRINPEPHLYRALASELQIDLPSFSGLPPFAVARFIVWENFITSGEIYSLSSSRHRNLMLSFVESGYYLPLVESMFLTRSPVEDLSEDTIGAVLRQIEQAETGLVQYCELSFVVSALASEPHSEHASRILELLINRELNAKRLKREPGSELISQNLGRLRLAPERRDSLSSVLATFAEGWLANRSKQPNSPLNHEFECLHAIFRSLQISTAPIYRTLTSVLGANREGEGRALSPVFTSLCELAYSKVLEPEDDVALRGLHQLLLANNPLNFMPRNFRAYDSYFQHFSFRQGDLSSPSHGSLRLLRIRAHEGATASEVKEYLNWALPSVRDESTTLSDGREQRESFVIGHLVVASSLSAPEILELEPKIKAAFAGVDLSRENELETLYKVLDSRPPESGEAIRRLTVGAPEFLAQHNFERYGLSSAASARLNSFGRSPYVGMRQAENIVRMVTSLIKPEKERFWLEKLVLGTPEGSPNELIHLAQIWIGLSADSRERFIAHRIATLQGEQLMTASRQLERSKRELAAIVDGSKANGATVPERVTSKLSSVVAALENFRRFSSAVEPGEKREAYKALTIYFRNELSIKLKALDERDALVAHLSDNLWDKLRKIAPCDEISQFVSKKFAYFTRSGVLDLFGMFCSFADESGLRTLHKLLTKMAQGSEIDVIAHSTFTGGEMLSLDLQEKFRGFGEILATYGFDDELFLGKWERAWMFSSPKGVGNHVVTLTHDLERWCRHGEEPVRTCQRLTFRAQNMEPHNWNHQFGPSANADGRPLARILLPQLKLAELRVNGKVQVRSTVELTIDSQAKPALLVEVIHSQFEGGNSLVEEFRLGILDLADQLGIPASSVYFSPVDGYPAPLPEEDRIYRDTFRP